jgi:hypothetical protein
MKKFLAQVGVPHLSDDITRIRYEEGGVFFVEAEDKQGALAELLKIFPEKNKEVLSVLADWHKACSEVPVFRGSSPEPMEAKPYNNGYYIVHIIEVSSSIFEIPASVCKVHGCERFEI